MADPKAESLEWKAKGNAALSAKNFEEAIGHYTKAIELDATNHVFFSNRSAAYLSLGKAAEALEDADGCIKAKPDWAKGYGRKGAALHALKKYDDSKAAYNEGLKLAPGNPQLTSGLKEVEDEEARSAGGPPGGFPNPFADPSALGRLATNPKFAGYMADPKFLQSIQAINANPMMLQTLMQTDMRLFEAWAFLAGLDFGGGAGGAAGAPGAAAAAAAAPAPEAAPEATEVEEVAPEEVIPETEEEREERERKEAEAKALAEKKEKGQALKAEGNKLYKEKKYAEAIAAYEEASKVDDTDITYRLNASAVHLASGDHEKAIEVAEEAIKVGRPMYAPFAHIARAFERIGNAKLRAGDMDGAIKAFEDSLTEKHSDDVWDRLKRTKNKKAKLEADAYLNPEEAAKAKERGNVHFKAGNFRGAIEEYSDAIKRDPKNAVYYANRAAAKMKVMDVNSAIADCDTAIKLDPTYVKAYERKGGLQFLNKEYHKAIDTYKAGLAVDETSLECKNGLQRTAAKISGGDEAERRARAERAMSDPEIQAILADPMVSETLKSMKTNPGVAQRAFADPSMSAKLSKLVAAGILG